MHNRRMIDPLIGSKFFELPAVEANMQVAFPMPRLDQGNLANEHRIFLQSNQLNAFQAGVQSLLRRLETWCNQRQLVHYFNAYTHRLMNNPHLMTSGVLALNQIVLTLESGKYPSNATSIVAVLGDAMRLCDPIFHGALMNAKLELTHSVADEYMAIRLGIANQAIARIHRERAIQGEIDRHSLINALNVHHDWLAIENIPDGAINHHGYYVNELPAKIFSLLSAKTVIDALASNLEIPRLANDPQYGTVFGDHLNRHGQDADFLVTSLYDENELEECRFVLIPSATSLVRQSLLRRLANTGVLSRPHMEASLVQVNGNRITVLQYCANQRLDFFLCFEQLMYGLIPGATLIPAPRDLQPQPQPAAPAANIIPPAADRQDILLNVRVGNQVISLLDYCMGEDRAIDATLDALRQNRLRDVVLLNGQARINLIDRDTDGFTIVHRAAAAGNVEMLAALADLDPARMNERDRTGRTPLMIAAQLGHIDAVRLLVARPGILMLAENQGKFTALSLAILDGHVDVVGVIAAHRMIDINQLDGNGYSPLHYAAAQGKLDIVRHLLALPTINASLRDAAGKTAHEWAVGGGYTEAARLINAKIIEQQPNAILNAPDHQHFTPISRAIIDNRIDDVRRLLVNPIVIVNALDRHGFAPLHYAAAQGRHDIVRLLATSNRIDFTMRDSAGKTALDWARGGNYHLIANLIQDRILNPQNYLVAPGQVGLFHHNAANPQRVQNILADARARAGILRNG